MNTRAVDRHRLVSAAVLVVLGGAVAAATWAGGSHGLAIGLVAFYVVAATAAWVVAGTDTDVAAVIRSQGDERQRSIERDAAALAGLAMGLFALAAAIVEIARSADPAPFGLVCAVGGLGYVGGLALPSLRRSAGR